MKYLTTEEFKSQVMDFTGDQKFLGDKPTIIKFTAGWCGPCKMMNPILEEIEKEMEGKIDIFNVDVDNEYEVSSAFGVRSIPNMVFFPLEGTPERMVGALPKTVIMNAIWKVFKIE